MGFALIDKLVGRIRSNVLSIKEEAQGINEEIMASFNDFDKSPVYKSATKIIKLCDKLLNLLGD